MNIFALHCLAGGEYQAFIITDVSADCVSAIWSIARAISKDHGCKYWELEDLDVTGLVLGEAVSVVMNKGYDVYVIIGDTLKQVDIKAIQAGAQEVVYM